MWRYTIVPQPLPTEKRNGVEVPVADHFCRYDILVGFADRDRYGFRMSYNLSKEQIMQELKRSRRPDAAEKVHRELTPRNQVQVLMSEQDKRRWLNMPEFRQIDSQITLFFKFADGQQTKSGLFPNRDRVPYQGDVVDGSLIGVEGRVVTHGEMVTWTPDVKETTLLFERVK